MDTKITQGELFRFAESLKRRPGKWVQHPSPAKAQAQIVNRLRHGRTSTMPPHLYEAKLVKGVAYVRYNPKKKEG